MSENYETISDNRIFEVYKKLLEIFSQENLIRTTYPSKSRRFVEGLLQVKKTRETCLKDILHYAYAILLEVDQFITFDYDYEILQKNEKIQEEIRKRFKKLPEVIILPEISQKK